MLLATSLTTLIVQDRNLRTATRIAIRSCRDRRPRHWAGENQSSKRAPRPSTPRSARVRSVFMAQRFPKRCADRGPRSSAVATRSPRSRFGYPQRRSRRDPCPMANLRITGRPFLRDSRAPPHRPSIRPKLDLAPFRDMITAEHPHAMRESVLRTSRPCRDTTPCRYAAANHLPGTLRPPDARPGRPFQALADLGARLGIDAARPPADRVRPWALTSAAGSACFSSRIRARATLWRMVLAPCTQS